MSEFKYNVITRDNCDEYGMSYDWWINHPDWNYFVRTDVRYSRNGMIWLGGGGKTLEEAVASATASVVADSPKRTDVVSQCFVIKPQEAKGTLTTDKIAN